MTEHKDKKDRTDDGPKPKFLARGLNVTPEEYWNNVEDAAKKAEGFLTYRPGGFACLGVIGNIANESVIPPRRTLTATPKHWNRGDVEEWAKRRGCTLISAISQRGDAAWLFRGWPPAKAESAKVLAFKSGIVLAPATAWKKKSPAAVATGKASWGTPQLKKEAEKKTDKPTAETVGSGAAAMEVETVKTQQTATGNTMKWYPNLPNKECFEAVECGGDGDCGFVVVGRALADKSGQKAKEEDLKPGGKVQEQLGLWAAKEIADRPDSYPSALPSAKEYAKGVAKNGTYANSISLLGASAGGENNA